MREDRSTGRRVVNCVIAIALAMSMVMAFVPPVVVGAATGSSIAGQAPTMAYVHYQIGHAPTISELPLSAAPTSKKVTVLAKNQDGPQPMAVSGGYVYFYDWGTDRLKRVSESGGVVQTLATADEGTTAAGVVVEGNYVYWTHTSRFSLWLNRTDISTGKTTNIYTAVPEEELGLGEFAVNGDHAYFVSDDNIYSIDTNGSNLVELAGGPSPCPLLDTYSAGIVFWFDSCTGQVGSVPASGGTAKLLSPALSSGGGGFIGVTQLVVHGSHIYWTFNGMTNSSVDTVSTSGKGFKMLYSTSGTSQFFGGLSYWDGKVLFADYYNYPSGAVYSIPQGGGKLHTVVAYPTVDLDVAGGTTYLVSPQDSTVAKTPA